MKDISELRTRAVANMQRLASGAVARELAEEKRIKAAQKEILKKNKRRIKQIEKRLEDCREELAGLEQYMEEMLETDEDKSGMLDECDQAIEGCVREINDLQDELVLLSNYVVPQS